MPRVEAKDTHGEPKTGDHSGNATQDSQEKNQDKKKQKRFNPYGNKTRNNGPRYYGKSRE